MNKLIITLLMAILAFSLSAQMGLFELSFGDSRVDASNNLIKKGFETREYKDTSASFYLEYPDVIDNVKFYFDSLGLLRSWVVAFKPYKQEDIEKIAIDALISWHGEDYYWDEETEKYYWDFPKDRYVSAGYDSYGYFIVEYNAPDSGYYPEEGE